MESYDERQRSFSNGNRPWPHPPSFQARPETLADAGFYFVPSAGWPDNVVCFLCNKELGDWERSEKPLEQHLSHTKNCGFAISKLPPNPFNWDNPDELPQGEHLFQARLQTFGKWWPHDHVKGWYGTSEKMARAGFIFCPTDESADNAQCSYCSAALEGWEPDDDPVHEHKRRFPHCPFFAVRPARAPSASSSTSSTLAPKQAISKQTAEVKKERKRRPASATSVKKDQKAPSLVRVKVETPEASPSIPTIVSAMKGHHPKGTPNPVSPARSVEFDLPNRTSIAISAKTSSDANRHSDLSTNSNPSKKSEASKKSDASKQSHTSNISDVSKKSDAKSKPAPTPIDKSIGNSSIRAKETQKPQKHTAPPSKMTAASITQSDSDPRNKATQPPSKLLTLLPPVTSAVPARSQLKAPGISVVIKKRKLTQGERDYNRERWPGISNDGEPELDHTDMAVGSPKGRVTSPGTTSESSPFMDAIQAEKHEVMDLMDVDENARTDSTAGHTAWYVDNRKISPPVMVIDEQASTSRGIPRQFANGTAGPPIKVIDEKVSTGGVIPRQVAKRTGGPPKKTGVESTLKEPMPRQVAKRKAGGSVKATNRKEQETGAAAKPRRKPSARVAAKKPTRGAKKAVKPLIEILLDEESADDQASLASAADAAHGHDLLTLDTHSPSHIEEVIVPMQDLTVVRPRSAVDNPSSPRHSGTEGSSDHAATPSTPPSPPLPSTPPQFSREASLSPPSTPVRERSTPPMALTPVRTTPSVPLLSTPTRGPTSIPYLSTPVRRQAVSLLDIELADVVVVDPATPIRRPASRADIEDWEDEELPGSAESHVSSPFMSPSNWLFDDALTTSTPKPKRSAYIPGITPHQRVRDVIGNASAMRSSTRRTTAYDSPLAKRTIEKQFDLGTDSKQNLLIDRLEVLMQENATSEVFAVAEQALQDEVQNMRRSQNKMRETGLSSNESPIRFGMDDRVMRTPVKQSRTIDLTGLEDSPRPKTPVRGTPLATVMSALGAASRRNNQGPFSPAARKTADLLKLSDLDFIPSPSKPTSAVQPRALQRIDIVQENVLSKTTSEIKGAGGTLEQTAAATRPLFEALDPEEREQRLRLMDETGLTEIQLSLTVEEFHRACIAEQVRALEVTAAAWIQQFDSECTRLRDALLDANSSE